MKNKIGVVNYKFGNTKSLLDALKSIDIKFKLINNSKDFSDTTHIILPGIGTFGQCINELRKKNMEQSLNHEIFKKRKFFLGICVGFQLMFNSSDENNSVKGLSWFPEKIEKMSKNYLLPHIGWNKVISNQKSSLFKNISQNSFFYFLHSYCLRKSKKKIIVSNCTYDKKFISSIEFENLHGVQFHPEKSQKSGLILLKNFSNL